MRILLISLLLLSNISFSQHHSESTKSEESPIVDNLPSLYYEFVEVVGILTTDEIIALIGEPAKKINIKMQSSNNIIASTWYYHNLNTDESGIYFPTTELDIIDGFVESVTFMNNINESNLTEGTQFDIKKQDIIF
ncbi:hypothetical protein N9472_00165 [Methylophilaceae bacterium]|jgi:hypothetical protein|nr:hypothetical protein [Methylophilaceae bacterium]|tara:strand:- start:2430 stop:2837 length:408 start_codon:yes stop_codon:yes gene_type:complete